MAVAVLLAGARVVVVDICNGVVWSSGGPVLVLRWPCSGHTQRVSPPEGESYYNVGGGAPLPGGAGPSLPLPPRN